MLYAEVNKEGI